jgi:hypothetical protein
LGVLLFVCYVRARGIALRTLKLALDIDIFASYRAKRQLLFLDQNEQQQCENEMNQYPSLLELLEVQLALLKQKIKQDRTKRMKSIVNVSYNSAPSIVPHSDPNRQVRTKTSTVEAQMLSDYEQEQAENISIHDNNDRAPVRSQPMLIDASPLDPPIRIRLRRLPMSTPECPLYRIIPYTRNKRKRVEEQDEQEEYDDFDNEEASEDGYSDDKEILLFSRTLEFDEYGRWHCLNGCGRDFAKTSLRSIRLHQRGCSIKNPLIENENENDTSTMVEAPEVSIEQYRTLLHDFILPFTSCVLNGQKYSTQPLHQNTDETYIQPDYIKSLQQAFKNVNSNLFYKQQHNKQQNNEQQFTKQQLITDMNAYADAPFIQINQLGGDGTKWYNK